MRLQPTPQSPTFQPYADRVLSLTEAARVAGVSKDTLRRCNRRSELKFIHLSPRRVGIRLSDLHSFLDARAA
jgi:excisionase family DNA binding protein